jgi:hypothetical protein
VCVCVCVRDRRERSPVALLGCLWLPRPETQDLSLLAKA